MRQEEVRVKQAWKREGMSRGKRRGKGVVMRDERRKGGETSVGKRAEE